MLRRCSRKLDIQLGGGLSNHRIRMSFSSGSSGSRTRPIAAAQVAVKTTSSYPAAFQSAVSGRSKRALGNMFGLKNFGVNQTTLEPGGASSSALLHYHVKQDEFVYILQGTAVVRLGNGEEIEMQSGDCIGFPAGRAVGHCIVNRSPSIPVVYLEIGDRTPGDTVEYPEVDLKAVMPEGQVDRGQWKFRHRDGRPYTDDEAKN